MKRGFVNSHQFCGSFDDEKFKRRFNNLLEDYLDLQKEAVSMKRRLQAQKQKRSLLAEEVRFLRQRYNYLTKPQLSKVEPELCVDQNAENPCPVVPITKDVNCVDQNAENPNPVVPIMKDLNCVDQNAENPDSTVLITKDLNCIINKEEGPGKELTWIKPCLKKKLNNCSTGETKREKRKVTWLDDVALGV